MSIILDSEQDATPDNNLIRGLEAVRRVKRMVEQTVQGLFFYVVFLAFAAEKDALWAEGL